MPISPHRLVLIHICCISLIAGPVSDAVYTIDTVAGTDFVGDAGPATAAQLGSAESVAVDALGNLYIADARDHRVRKVSPAGIITTVAGNGHPGFRGDGGPAPAALLARPYGVAVDRSGNLYIADTDNQRVRKVTPDGIIRTVAGGGLTLPDVPGDATAARLKEPRNETVDLEGNLYISDVAGHRVYKITAAGIISIAAGTGVRGFSGDGNTATVAQLNSPKGLAVDSTGALYIVDSGNVAIRKVVKGIITTVIHGGDGGGSGAAVLRDPRGVAVDSAGNLYIADYGNIRVRKITPDGVVTTVVSKDTLVAPGSAALSSALDVAVDAAGDLYIADGQRIAKVSGMGPLRTLAGDGEYDFRARGTAATMNRLYGPYGIAVDAAGNLYIADQENNRIRKVTKPGLMSTIAGPGVTNLGDGGWASSAYLSKPISVATDAAGNLWVAEFEGHRVRRIGRDGIISTVAGNGSPGFQGEAGLQLNSPSGVVADQFGNVYISDTKNYRVRKVDASGRISTVAGKGIPGYAGDGGSATQAPAAQALLDTPRGLALDGRGNLYIADQANHSVRKVTSDGIYTVAGTGVQGYGGDGDAATLARLAGPTGVALDEAGNLYIADSYNHRIRRVSPDGIITTIAGAGVPGFDGNGGRALLAQLHTPTGVAVDSEGNIFVADLENNQIRKLTPAAAGPVTPAPLQAVAVLNGAGMQSGPVAPGEIVSIFGSGLGPSKGVTGAPDSGGVWPKVLADVQVLFDGWPAALFYVQDNQINVQVSYYVAGQPTTQMEVLYGGMVEARLALAVAEASPGLFTMEKGTGQAIVVNEDGFLNSAANPAARGSIVTLYATGEGQTDPGGVNGKPAVAPYPRPLAPVSLRLGGYAAEILFAGAAPGFVGLLQINARVPAGYLGAGVLPVSLAIGGASSQPGVTMVVK